MPERIARLILQCLILTSAILLIAPEISAKEKPVGRSVRSQLPPGAILILTFENDTLRRKNGKLIEVIDLARGVVGKVIGDAIVVQGKVGNGLEFAGDGSYVEISGEFPIGAQPRSMAAWLKARETSPEPGYCCLVMGTGGDNKAFAIRLGTGMQGWFFWHGNHHFDTKIVADKDWHHHCVTYDGATVTYFLDGHEVASVKRVMNTAAGPLVLGTCPDKKRSFRGMIDEVAVFDRALSAAEVERLYQMGEKGILLASPH